MQSGLPTPSCHHQACTACTHCTPTPLVRLNDAVAGGQGSALQLVLGLWTERFLEFQGAYHIKLSVSALALLLATRHPALAAAQASNGGWPPCRQPHLAEVFLRWHCCWPCGMAAQAITMRLAIFAGQDIHTCLILCCTP